ncbi:uncharacterized protein LOC123321042 [Coccinella septempunctata]|uniref:uncharacterized protein LOC123321042 n=1 Tax=Coccinella septempunctata TaxID=41139 RepID=UPI001D08BAE0|nr:uncharacterized protein LOC123321042 [Coccinella septempunctata]
MTNKVSSEYKREAWEEISRNFNACSSVPRTSQQLKTLYENLKRRGRKDLALENKDRYRELLSNMDQGEENIIIDQLREKARQEKKEMMATGGGSFKNMLDDTERRIISILGDNARPLEIPFDDAHIYFEYPIPAVETEPIPNLGDPDPIPDQGVNPIPNQWVDPEPCGELTSTSLPPITKKLNKTRAPLKRLIRKKTLTPKDRYYLKKLENAKIEQKILKLQLRKTLFIITV